MRLDVEKNKQTIVAVLVLLTLAFGLCIRLLSLERYPLSVNQDELSNLYDGYAIAETGADRWGQKYPMILRGFGASDYRPPLYAWLSAGTIKLFGFSVFSGRLVSALLGCASLVLIYRVAKKIAGTVLAFFALLLAVFSPWHMLFSRTASEGAMLPPFCLIGACYLWQQAHEHEYRLKYLALLGLLVGLGTNSYQAGKLVFFFFAVLVLANLWRHSSKFFGKAAVFGLSCLAGAGPQIITVLTMPDQFFSRASGSAVAYSFSFNYFGSIGLNIISNLLPKFLFFSFKSNNLSVGRLLAVECLIFYVGLVLLHKVMRENQAISARNFYALLFIVIIPSALTTDNPHALRASGLIVLLPLVTAAGISVVHKSIRDIKLKTAFLALAATAIIGNGLFFIKTYLGSKTLQGQGMQHELVELATRIDKYKSDYDRIYIDSDANQPYIYIASYCHIRPSDFQKADKQINRGTWDDFKKLGKYHFLSESEIEKSIRGQPAKSLVVLRTKTDRYRIIDSVGVGKKTYLYSTK